MGVRAHDPEISIADARGSHCGMIADRGFYHGTGVNSVSDDILYLASFEITDVKAKFWQWHIKIAVDLFQILLMLYPRRSM